MLLWPVCVSYSSAYRNVFGFAKQIPHSNHPSLLPPSKQSTLLQSSAHAAHGPHQVQPTHKWLQEEGTSSSWKNPTTRSPQSCKRRCEQVPWNTLQEKITHALKYGQSHDLVHLRCPPCLEYIFLNDLCVCAVREVT